MLRVEIDVEEAEILNTPTYSVSCWFSLSSRLFRINLIPGKSIFFKSSTNSIEDYLFIYLLLALFINSFLLTVVVVGMLEFFRSEIFQHSVLFNFQ